MTTGNSDLLTLRAGVLHAAQSLATVVGGITAAFVQLRVAVAVDVELAMFAVAFAWTLWRVPQRSRDQRSMSTTQSSQLHTRTNSTPISGSGGGINSTGAKSFALRCAALREFFDEVWQLLRDGFWVYRRPRLGHRRAFIWTTVFVLMITYTTSVETRISEYIFYCINNHYNLLKAQF